MHLSDLQGLLPSPEDASDSLDSTERITRQRRQEEAEYVNPLLEDLLHSLDLGFAANIALGENLLKQ